ncbi:hypothetical protein [Persephonella sp. IF05-L8]|uniref:hypothetical protein n=1 Tax=Persephonella sp. IF05-L8 TaxID=1158338 RepID=UPI0004969CB3
MFLKQKGQGAILFFLVLYTTAFSQESFIDILHREVSILVYSTVEKLDTFFADPKIKEETRAYIRLRAGFEYNTSPQFTNILKSDFKLRLARLEKNLDLHIENLSQNLSGNKLNKHTKEKNKTKTNFLKHRFSIGLTGSPKIYAKYQIYNKPIIYKRWELTAYQRFRVERKLNNYRVEEKTEIYIDRLIRKNTIWRIYIGRRKVSNIPYQLLTYSTAIRIYNPLQKIHKKPNAIELYGGINQHKLIKGYVNSYIIQGAYRLNFWKKWTFFNIYIGSNWEKDRGFKGIPFIKVFFEFYFGKM